MAASAVVIILHELGVRFVPVFGTLISLLRCPCELEGRELKCTWLNTSDGCNQKSTKPLGGPLRP
eukprot:4784153-Amphidinium_carterae.1